jgi:hypothetical protein
MPPNNAEVVEVDEDEEEEPKVKGAADPMALPLLLPLLLLLLEAAPNDRELEGAPKEGVDVPIPSPNPNPLDPVVDPDPRLEFCPKLNPVLSPVVWLDEDLSGAAPKTGVEVAAPNAGKVVGVAPMLLPKVEPVFSPVPNPGADEEIVGARVVPVGAEVEEAPKENPPLLLLPLPGMVVLLVPEVAPNDIAGATALPPQLIPDDPAAPGIPKEGAEGVEPLTPEVLAGVAPKEKPRLLPLPLPLPAAPNERLGAMLVLVLVLVGSERPVDKGVAPCAEVVAEVVAGIEENEKPGVAALEAAVEEVEVEVEVAVILEGAVDEPRAKGGPQDNDEPSDNDDEDVDDAPPKEKAGVAAAAAAVPVADEKDKFDEIINEILDKKNN